MTDSQVLAIGLPIWLVAMGFMASYLWRRPHSSAGLLFGHMMNMWLLHWLAPTLYLMPWYYLGGYRWYQPVPRDLVVQGFLQSLFGTLAFVVGAIVYDKTRPRVERPLIVTPADSSIESKIAVVYLVLGQFTYFVLPYIIGGIPGAAAFISNGWNLTIVGLGLGCWLAWSKGHRAQMLKWIGLSLCIPLLTLSSMGFMSFGVAMLMTLIAFISAFYRPRWQIVLAGGLSIYLFLSIFVTYTRDREAYRERLHSGAGYSERLGMIFETFSAVEPFNPFNDDHLSRVDGRLNQSALVGASVAYLGERHKDYAWGDTLLDGFLALIPRAIWPDKPMKAGSGTLVADYTGIPYDNTTTAVGVGQVMEFYINFGTAGVVAGFLFMGYALAWIDRRAARRLAARRFPEFAFWFLLGVNFLSVIGSFTELTMSTGSAIVTASLINRYILPRLLKWFQPMPGQIPHLSTN
jgi:hypothetical protein